MNGVRRDKEETTRGAGDRSYGAARYWATVGLLNPRVTRVHHVRIFVDIPLLILIRLE